MKQAENSLKLHFCDDLSERLSSDEVRQVLHIKRFLECMAGDKKFRNAFDAEPEKRIDLLHSRGIFGVDPEQVSVLVPKEFSENGTVDIDLDTAVDRYPQAQLWKSYRNASLAFQNKILDQIEPSSDKHYNKWRERQIKRCDSELGERVDQKNPHFLVAFELNQGCSIGCHFCGVSAGSLKETFKYTPENATLWHQVLEVFASRFGAAAQRGFCYWATEPSDNPDYLQFIADFGEVIGAYPLTTTAAPLRNLEWTRRLLTFRQEHATYVDRFSVLSAGILRRIHEIFSAEDLALVELLFLGKDSLQPKVRTGRNLQAKPGKPDVAGSIACISGYLLNMVEHSIKLISPCSASARWPLGYRIYTESRFSTASDVDRFISDTIKEYMQDKPGMDNVLAFRGDLEYIPVDNGFHLRNSHYLHKMTGAPYLAELGRQINQSNTPLNSLFSDLLGKYPDIFSISASVQNLFDSSLLADGLDDLHPN